MLTEQDLAAIEARARSHGDETVVPLLVSEVRALRGVVRELVPVLQQVAAEEFERAMRPDPRQQPVIVRPIYQDLALRLATYIETIEGKETTHAD